MANLRDVLLAIRDEYGHLNPQVVVEASRPSDAPLHHKFEWNDSIAAEKHRRAQAQELIQSVKISYQPENRPPQHVRQFHATYDPRYGHVYTPVEEVLEDPLARQLLLRDMQRDWLLMKDRYDRFTEFWQMVADEAQEHTGS